MPTQRSRVQGAVTRAPAKQASYAPRAAQKAQVGKLAPTKLPTKANAHGRPPTSKVHPGKAMCNFGLNGPGESHVQFWPEWPGRVTPIPHGTNIHIGDPTVWGRNIVKTTLLTHRAGNIGGGKTRVEIITHIWGTNPGPSKTIAQMGKTRVRRGMMGEKHIPTAEGASLD